jgi:SAM-dependent MidA family methyltransferase
VQAQLSRGLQLLMSEAEMGELFKVIAFTKNGEAPAGFERGDRSHRLQEDTYA